MKYRRWFGIFSLFLLVIVVVVTSTPLGHRFVSSIMETRLNTQWSQSKLKSSVAPITGIFPFDFSIPSATLDLSGLLTASLTNAHVVYKPFSWLPYGGQAGETIHIERMQGPITLKDVTIHVGDGEYMMYGDSPVPYQAFFNAHGSNVTINNALVFDSVTDGNHTHIETKYVSLDVERTDEITIITNVMFKTKTVIKKIYMDERIISIDDCIRLSKRINPRTAKLRNVWVGKIFGEEVIIHTDPFHVFFPEHAQQHKNVTLLTPFREISTTHDGIIIDVGLYPVTIKPPTIQHGPVSLTFDSSGLKVHTRGGELAGFKCIEVDAEINNTEYAVIHSFRASREDGQVVSGRGTFIFAEKKLELSADINF